MISLIEVKSEEVNITEAYITEDESALEFACEYVHEGGDIEDVSDFHAFEFCGFGQFVADLNGRWSDFEIMAPSIISKELCQRAETVIFKTGYPLLKFNGEADKVMVQKETNSFTVWFAENLGIDLVVKNGTAEFYFSTKRLVGFKAVTTNPPD